MNLAKLLEGPAVMKHRGVYFESRGGSVLTPSADAFEVGSDRWGAVDQRASENTIQLAFTPMGVWLAAVLGVLYRWANPLIGQLVTPRYDVDTVSAENDTLTLLGTETPRIGCPVNVASDGVLPAGLTEATLYYLGVPDAISAPLVCTLHDTEAHAIAGTNQVDLTDVGTGNHFLIEQEPLEIWTTMNRKVTFPNAAIVVMPPLQFSPIQTLLGSVSIEAFRTNNAAWSDANSLYTVTKEVLNVTPPDPATIPTQPYTYAFGAAPWDNFEMRAPFSFTPALKLEPVSSDGRGIESRKISGISVTGRGVPHGFSEQQLLDLMKIQGAGAGRGVSRVRANLDISGTGAFARIYNAAARVVPQRFSTTDPRAGEVEFISARSPNSPAFYVGTTAPA
jgi:hypothetical protein